MCGKTIGNKMVHNSTKHVNKLGTNKYLNYLCSIKNAFSFKVSFSNVVIFGVFKLRFTLTTLGESV